MNLPHPTFYIRHLLLPLERAIRNKFIPALTGCHIWSDKERVLISLPNRWGGLAILLFNETVEIEFMNSTKSHQNLKQWLKGFTAALNRR